jgi:hypothetical protein
MPKTSLITTAANDMVPLPIAAASIAATNYEECLSCQ